MRWESYLAFPLVMSARAFSDATYDEQYSDLAWGRRKYRMPLRTGLPPFNYIL